MSVPATTLTRRERSRLRKTELILTTALDMVADNGLAGLTIQGLARALDWAPGALYRYFPSKDALFSALQQRVINRYENELSGFLAVSISVKNKDNSLAALTVTALHYANYSQDNPNFFHLISSVLADPQPLLPSQEGTEVMTAVDQILQRITATIDKAQNEGVLSVGNPSDRTLVFWAATQGVLQLKKLARFAPERLDNARLLRRTLTDLLLGWGGEPNAVHEAVSIAQEHVESLLTA